MRKHFIDRTICGIPIMLGHKSRTELVEQVTGRSLVSCPAFPEACIRFGPGLRSFALFVVVRVVLALFRENEDFMELAELRGRDIDDVRICFYPTMITPEDDFCRTHGHSELAENKTAFYVEFSQ